MGAGDVVGPMVRVAEIVHSVAKVWARSRMGRRGTAVGFVTVHPRPQAVIVRLPYANLSGAVRFAPADEVGADRRAGIGCFGPAR